MRNLREEVNRAYAPTPISEAKLNLSNIIGSVCKDLSNIILDLTPEGLDQTLAIRKIREAAFYASSAIWNAPEPEEEDQNELPFT